MVTTDWKFVVQSRLRMPLREWVKKHRIKTYEEAVNTLQSAGLPLGSSEEMAAVFPGPANKSSAPANSTSLASDNSPRRTQEILQRKAKEDRPRSAAEAAADAITESTAIKSPQEKTTRRRTRKSKKA